MKIFTFLSFLLISITGFSQINLPITFEDAMIDYDLTDFEGNGPSAIVVDPTNAGNMVAQVLKSNTAGSSAGTTMGEMGIANPIPFSAGNTTMSVRVWSPDAGIQIRLKVETAGDPTISVETEATTTTAMAWETLVFDFNNQATGTAAINFASVYNKISIFFNFGVEGAIAGNKTYYWDDVTFGGIAPPSLPALPITFEDAMLDYDLTDFGGNTSSIVVDPTDATNMVGQAIKGDMAELWAGTTMSDGGLASAIPFAADATKMTVRVWSPDAGIPVRLKVEQVGVPTISVETEATTTTAMAWETLEFDFSNQADGTAAIDFANTYDKISIFFNFGTTGAEAGEKTYYWDDVEFVTVVGPTLPDLPITFEDGMLDYDLTDFGGNTSSIVVDPTDATNMVGQAIKGDMAELWAGTTMSDAGLASAIPFAADATKMTVRVWSPDAGIPVRLKVEQVGVPTISVETEATTTTAMAWETLEFDFSNQADGTAAIDFANTYDKISIFFNFGTTGAEAGEKTYYWDDVEFVTVVGPTLPDLPITFEDGMLDYDLTDFGGNTSSIVVDPTDATNMVGQAIKGDMAELWAGTTMSDAGLASAIPFAADATKMTVRVWSPDAGIPVRLKVEQVGVPTISVETEATTTTAMAWETLEFDFSNQADGTAAIDFANTYDKISIFFNFGTTGAEAGEKTYYWDDVEFVTVVGPTLPDLPITFEDGMLDYDLTDFGGNTSSIVVDPTDATNMVGQAIKGDMAELWAGTTMSDAGLASAIPFAADATKMTVRVWSPDAGIPVRLKVEQVGVPTISVETEATTTTAMAWETLELDFSNQADGTAAIDFANTYDKISIFFNFGTTGADAGEKTYYWDDVQFGGIVVDPVLPDLPITFEDATVTYDLTDFAGNASSIVVDPTDATNMVGQAIKTDMAEVFAGTTMSDAGLANAVPFAPGLTTMTVRVWSPDAGTPIRLKVEDKTDPNISVETEVMTTTAMAWETLEFNFSTQVGGTAAINFGSTYDKISIFFNFGTTGADAGEKTYYWDDVVFITEVAPRPDLPITFEDTMLDYSLVDFGGNASSIIVDPTDATNTVGQAIKTDMAELWAGTTMGGSGLENAIPFAMDDTKMTVRVWSPDAGIQIRLKAEDATDPTISVETEATTTVAMAWETLEFDFSNEVMGTAAINFANTYDKLSIFFNFGTTGADAGEKTYYWDDVEFGARVTVVDIIVNSADHMTLEDAVIAAELADDLSGAGPFTVFAPTDEAFDAVDPDYLAELLADPTGDLAQVLLYHAHGTEMYSDDLTDGQIMETLQGEDATITINVDGVFVNSALITMADIPADNGVVHVINAVLLPPSFVGVDIVSAAANNIKVMPNPANTHFYIEFPDVLNEEALISIFDVSGKLLRQENIQDQISEISTSELNSGTYFLRIDTDKGSYFQKLMIAK